MKTIRSLELSRKVSLALIVLTLANIIALSNWRKESRVIYHDVKGYYCYLPSLVIYKDIQMKFLDDMPEMKKKFWSSTYKTDEGNIYYSKYTMGIAVLNSPLFFVAHGLTKLFSPEHADGYSILYRFALLISSFVYFIIGLTFLRKTLNRFFDQITCSWTIVIIVLGTNLWYFTTYSPTMSHVYSFSMVSLFVYYSINWWDNKTIKNSILVGVFLGIVALIRPTNFVIILFFVLFGTRGLKSVVNNIYMFISKYWIQSILIAIVVFLIMFPQFLYYKIVFDKWYFYSYTNEKILWSDPEVLNGLFSIRKGWLVYTPLMMLSIFGMVSFYLSNNQLKNSVAITFMVVAYIAWSWWCWWYGGGFGQRTMIDIYAILALPIARSIELLLKQKKLFKRTSLVCVILLIVLSLFQSKQYRRGVIHYDSYTWESYFLSFGKLKRPKGYFQTLKKPDYDKALIGIESYDEDYYNKKNK